MLVDYLISIISKCQWKNGFLFILHQQMTDQKTLFARGATLLVIFGTSDKIL